MNTLIFLKMFLTACVALVGLDAIWLAKIAPSLYKNNIGHLMAKNPNMAAAGLFYFIYIIGLVVFVIYPAYENKSIAEAVVKGALFGLVSYATFDLTAQAVFKNWPIKITIIDLTWGTVLTSSICLIATSIAIKYW